MIANDSPERRPRKSECLHKWLQVNRYTRRCKQCGAFEVLHFHRSAA